MKIDKERQKLLKLITRVASKVEDGMDILIIKQETNANIISAMKVAIDNKIEQNMEIETVVSEYDAARTMLTEFINIK